MIKFVKAKLKINYSESSKCTRSATIELVEL